MGWETWSSTCKRGDLDPYLTPHTKINTTWIQDLNVRLEPIKLQEENIREELQDIGFGDDFLNMPPKHGPQG